MKDATDDKNYDLAIKLLDAVIAIKPDYVEAWNRRATVYYLKQDYGHSLADLREVLAREPRHFGALVRPRPHPAGHRRRQGRARSLSQGARDRSAPREHSRGRQDVERKGRRAATSDLRSRGLDDLRSLDFALLNPALHWARCNDEKPMKGSLGDIDGRRQTDDPRTRGKLGGVARCAPVGSFPHRLACRRPHDGDLVPGHFRGIHQGQ